MDRSADTFRAPRATGITRGQFLQRVGAGSALLVTPGLLAACSDDTKGTGPSGVLRIGSELGTLAESMNPFVAYSLEPSLLSLPTLVQYGPDLQIESNWAESWETSRDGRTWTFHLRKGGWSDGKPLTAEDAVWNVKTSLEFGDIWSWLAGFGGVANVKDVRAPDKQTLVLVYDEATTGILEQLTQYIILPPQAWKGQTGNNGKDLRDFDPMAGGPMVAGGPYVCTKFDPKGAIRFEPNGRYYGPPVKVDTVGWLQFKNLDALIKGLRGNDVDFAQMPGKQAATLRGAENLSLVTGEGLYYSCLHFNSNPEKPNRRELLDPRVREAFSLAIDRKQIAADVHAGFAEPAGTFIPKAVGKSSNSDLKADPVDRGRASQILDELGYTRGSDGTRRANGERMRYDVIIVPQWVPLRELEVAQAGLKEIGVELRPKVVPEANWATAIYGADEDYRDYDIGIVAYDNGPSPDTSLLMFLREQFAGYNDSAFTNAEYERLYREQTHELDEERRRELLWRMQEIVIKEQRPHVPLVVTDNVFALSNDWEGANPKLKDSVSPRWLTDLRRNS